MFLHVTIQGIDVFNKLFADIKHFYLKKYTSKVSSK